MSGRRRSASRCATAPGQSPAPPRRSAGPNSPRTWNRFAPSPRIRRCAVWSSACPLSLDGSESPRTQSVRAFARNLAPLHLPILLWDERWSTQAVTRALIEADASRARRAELVDKMAAAYILQGAIDMLAGLGDGP